MKTKFLVLIFACALISTPTVESKITLHGFTSKASMINSLVCILATSSSYCKWYKDPHPSEEIINNLVGICFLETLVALPTTYCLYKETKNNTFLTIVNGLGCLYALKKAIETPDKSNEINNSSSNAPELTSEEDKNKHSIKKIVYSFATLYYALVAYQLNK